MNEFLLRTAPPQSGLTSASRLNQAIRGSLLIVATIAAMPHQARAADESASDDFVAKVMLMPQPHSTAHGVSAPDVANSWAADQFVERVLLGRADTAGSVTSARPSSDQPSIYHAPNLRFMFGSAP